jgi:hypothetical protein
MVCSVFDDGVSNVVAQGVRSKLCRRWLQVSKSKTTKPGIRCYISRPASVNDSNCSLPRTWRVDPYLRGTTGQLDQVLVHVLSVNGVNGSARQRRGEIR